MSLFFEEPLAPAALMPQLVNLRSVGVPLRAAERQGRGFIQVCTGDINGDLRRNES